MKVLNDSLRLSTPANFFYKKELINRLLIETKHDEALCAQNERMMGIEPRAFYARGARKFLRDPLYCDIPCNHYLAQSSF